MKLIRNGIEFELTEEEMQKAKTEIQFADVKSVIGDGSAWNIKKEKLDEFCMDVLCEYQFRLRENTGWRETIECIADDVSYGWNENEWGKENKE